MMFRRMFLFWCYLEKKWLVSSSEFSVVVYCVGAVDQVSMCKDSHLIFHTNYSEGADHPLQTLSFVSIVSYSLFLFSVSGGVESEHESSGWWVGTSSSDSSVRLPPALHAVPASMRSFCTLPSATSPLIGRRHGQWVHKMQNDTTARLWWSCNDLCFAVHNSIL